MKKKQPPIVVVILEHARSTGRTWELELETPNDSYEFSASTLHGLFCDLRFTMEDSPDVGREIRSGHAEILLAALPAHRPPTDAEVKDICDNVVDVIYGECEGLLCSDAPGAVAADWDQVPGLTEQDHASVRDLVSRAVRTPTSALRVTPTVGRHWNLDLGDLAALADAVGVPIIERRPARPARKRAAKKKAAKKPARRSR